MAENAAFGIAGTILDARENRSGASDNALSLAPDRFWCASKMAPAIANSTFSMIKTPSNRLQEGYT